MLMDLLILIVWVFIVFGVGIAISAFIMCCIVEPLYQRFKGDSHDQV